MTKYTKQRLLEMMNRVAEMPEVQDIDALLSEEGQIFEKVDTEKDFPDLKTTECWNTDELKNYLNDILVNAALPSHKRKKPEVIIHHKLIKQTETGDIDVQEFINNITEVPPRIITGGNSKMLKSSGDDFYTVTIGLPAFRGLVVDIGAKPPQFFVVVTCPGASEKCMKVCYARKGNFVRLPAVNLKQTRILNYLLNDPEGFKGKLKEEIKVMYRKGKKNNKNEMRFRWNDAGDFFTKKYFQIATDLMKELQSEGFNVKPYAHTKVADIYNISRAQTTTVDPSGLQVYQKPDFIVSFSVDADPKELEKVNLEGAKTSEIMYKDWQDLFQRDKTNHFLVDDNDKLVWKDPENGPDMLKQRVSQSFGVPNDDTLLLHDEMLKTPMADVPTYNVIVQSKGETDISTQRHDVKRTFFMVH